MKMLDITFDNRYQEDCINIDFHPVSDKIIEVNLLQELPLEENSIICKECLRVLEETKKDQNQKQFYEWMAIELLDQLVRTRISSLYVEVKK